MKRLVIVTIFLLLINVDLLAQNQLHDLYPTLITQYENIIDQSSNDLSEVPSVLRKIQDTLINSKQSYLLLSLFPLYEKLESHPSANFILVAKEYTKLGYVLKSLESFIDPAISIYHKALHFSAKNPKRDDYWFIENVLGNLYNMKGDLERSIFYYQSAKDGLEKLISQNNEKKDTYRDYRIRLNNNIAYLHYWNKEYNKSIHLLKENIISANTYKNEIAVALGLRYLIETYTSLDSLDEAITQLEQYQKNIQNLPENKRNFEQRMYHVLSGNISMKKKQYHDAIIAYTKATENFKFDHRDRFVAKIFDKLAQADLLDNQLQNAQIALHKGYKSLNVTYPDLLAKQENVLEENAVAELLETQTRLYLANYKISNDHVLLDSAINSSQHALEIYQGMRVKYALEGSKIQIAADQRRLVELVISTIVLKHPSHSHQLINEIKPYLALLKNTLQSDLEYERFIIKNAETPKITQLLEEIRILTSINESNPDAEVILKNDKTILENRQQIQAFLPKNKLTQKNKPRKSPYVEFAIVDDLIWRLDNLGGTESLTIIGGKDSIEYLFNRIQIELHKKSELIYPLLYQMHQRLFVGISSWPEKTGILSDGFLLDLPFAALIVTESPRTYLVQKTSLYHLIERSFPNKSQRTNAQFAILSPKYSGSGALLPLPFAAQEEKLIQSIFSQSIVYKDIQKSQFFDILSQYGTVHYSGHALLKETKPYIAIGDNIKDWVSIEEIIRAPINTKTIVLAACETAQGIYKAGEGAYSLSKAFINSGSASVVSTLWPVNDQVTTQMMKEMYSVFSKEKDMTVSVNAAQRSYLSSAKGVALHPYYWAGITVSEEDPISQNPLWIYMITSIIVLTFIFLIIKIKTK
ncbi:MAG: CHAT domain-containing protein [Saprospiraceae bacterium]